MAKSLIHPNRCRNGCSLFEKNPCEDDPTSLVMGYCRAHGGYTAIYWDQEIFMKVRGCCTYGCTGKVS